ncbi:hypothetical protein PFLmoz3_02795 [Pseudomonas fluorescens]|uniref:Uncharacterized protein n=1 Tax=Pseudomonas fluorescens TaxID=294 RepID=A0A109LGQ7_PSEFL|nr:hypothetical protein PFLmoz3_02795 [Pseudomonas fluorescens]
MPLDRYLLILTVGNARFQVFDSANNTLRNYVISTSFTRAGAVVLDESLRRVWTII